MRFLKFKIWLHAWLFTLVAISWAARLECEQLVTPRVFGGHLKHTEYLSTAMDLGGGMLAGGYTQDESIFIQTIRPDIDDAQIQVPILAYYPYSSFNDVKIYQVHIWPSSMPISQEGRVVAVSAVFDFF